MYDLTQELPRIPSALVYISLPLPYSNHCHLKMIQMKTTDSRLSHRRNLTSKSKHTDSSNTRLFEQASMFYLQETLFHLRWNQLILQLQSSFALCMTCGKVHPSVEPASLLPKDAMQRC